MSPVDTGSADEPGGATRPDAPTIGLGGALRHAWVGYRRRLDAALAVAGFGDRGLPDGRVLRICARSGNTTVSEIGRELGITRQGASKIVAGLAERRYVTLTGSATDRREKIITLTPRATDYLAAHAQAARRIEHELRAQIGNDAFDSLHRLLGALGGDEQPRMSDYLRSAWNPARSSHADD
ncbi:MAG: MarR family winged helix-turn-helix transcriptional regulator [Solirubrobacteraceae bacterium]